MDPNKPTDEIKEQAREREAEGEFGALTEDVLKEEGASAQLSLDDLDSAAGGMVVYLCSAPEDEERFQMP